MPPMFLLQLMARKTHHSRRPQLQHPVSNRDYRGACVAPHTHILRTSLHTREGLSQPDGSTMPHQPSTATHRSILLTASQ